jgi:hypothetical protein
MDYDTELVNLRFKINQNLNKICGFLTKNTHFYAKNIKKWQFLVEKHKFLYFNYLEQQKPQA